MGDGGSHGILMPNLDQAYWQFSGAYYIKTGAMTRFLLSSYVFEKRLHSTLFVFLLFPPSHPNTCTGACGRAHNARHSPFVWPNSSPRIAKHSVPHSRMAEQHHTIYRILQLFTQAAHSHMKRMLHSIPDEHFVRSKDCGHCGISMGKWNLSGNACGPR